MKLCLSDRPVWSPKNARELAAMSARAYRDQTVSDFGTDTHALIEYDETGAIVIAFRGTASLRSFLTDGDFFREQLVWSHSDEFAEVHRGFLAAFESILPKVHETLAGMNWVAPIFVTGHSLGGALAILCALELKRQHRNVHSVYTFGQPRVGNAVFMKLYNYSLGDVTWRHVFENDIIARIPHLPTFSDPYRHCGCECFLPEHGQPQFDPALSTVLWNDLKNAWRALTVQHTGVIEDALKDHHIQNYIDRLAFKK